ncbi:TonB family protein [Pyxidicoccus fallax]|uniref:TonB family protein n=2 Tax=Pyxidicoccus fallax TaxID=394095 RepID=A0A848LY69_9BACT|nr:TonB family protein [Pyxidicoccus fallax]NMO23025.1 TonB family protein [Pyxidicoccus fallax]NPC85578.1 TonB family protein [Pyxidicoccus fallax]
MQTDSRTSPTAAPAPTGDALLGQVLHGRFKVLEPLGAGGMGRVYRALQLPLERVVALKVLSPTFPTTRDPEFQQRFFLEASVTAKLRHPNTVTVIDYGKTDDGTFYIAMEYLEGRTLAEHLAAGPLPWTRAVDIARGVCRSLREAHRLGVVHRDLKPANVMLVAEEGGGEKDHVKVLDFGLVKSFLPDGAGLAVPEMTQGGTFLGSPTYMAPEQARNVADARSDIYSLGVLLYQMLVGRPPFVSKDALELIFAHHKEPPPHFRALRPDLAIPDAVEAVVRRCLEKAPEQRYATMDEVLDALRDAAGLAVSGPISAPHLALPPATGPHPAREGTMVLDISVDEESLPRPVPPRRSWRWPVVGAVALLGVGAGAFLLGSRGGRATQAGPVAPVAVTPAPAVAPAAEAPRGPVRFRVSSEPAGARVFWKGQERGVTPLVLEVPPGPDGMATAELTFVLEGYQTDRVVAGGSGEVLFTQRLQRQRGGGGGRPAVAAAPAPEPGGLSAPELMSAPTPLEAPATARPAVGGSPGRTVAASARAASGSGPINLPEEAKPPVELASNARPEFPQAARAAGKEGQVILKIVVTEAGEVRDVTVLRGEEPFVSAAVRAVSTWRYQPALLEGRPITVYRVVKVPFRLR